MIKGIIFDMDGVLTDSEPLNEEVTRTVLKEKYNIIDSVILSNNFRGVRSKDQFDILKSTFNVNGTFEDYMDFKKEIHARLHNGKEFLFSDSKKVLEELKENYKLALCTSSIRPTMEKMLKKMDLNIFETIITGDLLKSGKPNPECYIKSINGLKLQPNQCVIIEDAINGVKAAKASGAYCIAVLGSFSKKELIDAGADIVINNIKDLTQDIILRLGRDK